MFHPMAYTSIAFVQGHGFLPSSNSSALHGRSFCQFTSILFVFWASSPTLKANPQSMIRICGVRSLEKSSIIFHGCRSLCMIPSLCANLKAFTRACIKEETCTQPYFLHGWASLQMVTPIWSLAKFCPSPPRELQVKWRYHEDKVLSPSNLPRPPHLKMGISTTMVVTWSEQCISLCLCDSNLLHLLKQSLSTDALFVFWILWQHTLPLCTNDMEHR